jgi:predicted transcriptional regulator
VSGLFIVNREGALAGVITRGDILHSLQEDSTGHRTVLEEGRTDLVVTYPDEPLHDALAKMLKRDIGRLPVVDRECESRFLGYLGRADILAARSRYLMEEELREQGPLLKARNPKVESRKDAGIQAGTVTL